ncbi:Uncharacterized protein PECH_003908 [Penicillium ucsense]|uniref:Poly [ADP-ribose] polymerase n=1 Tax=Penicillium ucsense TaxID=2839758 RepID=A0A8J8WH98_9EURO|nr:Uncharacterized protein PECM_005674 [Penicillium ucsense]KAF7737453.1 Uncharacterized protein PECH_003908 [Penicillium ucsense]
MGTALTPASKTGKSSTEATPAGKKSNFKGVVVAVSGLVPAYKHEDIQDMVEACGAKFEKMNINDCTHLITTAECYRKATAPYKVKRAKQLSDCSIVTVDWLLQSIEEKTPLDTKGFLVKSLGLKRPVTGTPACRRKRKRAGDEITAIEQPGKIAKDRLKANHDRLKRLVDKAIHDAGKGDVLVWMDDEDIVYDATLLSTESCLGDNSREKSITGTIVRLQLIVDMTATTYHTWLRETKLVRSTQSGILQSLSDSTTVTSKGDGQLSSAIAEYHSKFEGFTGHAWDQAFKDPSKKKNFIFVHRADANDQEKLSDPELKALDLIVRTARPKLDGVLAGYVNRLLEEPGIADHFLETGVALADLIAKVSDGSRKEKKSPKVCANDLKRCFVRIFGKEGASCSKDIKAGFIEQTKHEIEGQLSLRAIDASLAGSLVPSSSSSATPVMDENAFRFLRLKSMKMVEADTDEYLHLAGYYNHTYPFHTNIAPRILNIYSIEREGEAERFAHRRAAASNKGKSHRRLLWHGTRTENLPSIFRTGLVSGPSRGIYFGDFSAKSFAYCRLAHPTTQGFMLLNEVELGVQIPLPRPGEKERWSSSGYTDGSIEYIVHNPAQVRLRYLFHLTLDPPSSG